MNKPRIEVLSHVMMAASHLTDMLRTYDVDTTNSPLSMPERLAIGSSFEGHLINTYQDQVSAYDIWLEDTLRGPDSLEKTRVMVALDNVYNMSVTGGVIIVTLAAPIPFWTHAHVVRRTILSLAGE